MSAIKLRIEVERALQDFTTAHGLASKRPKSISTVLRDMKERGMSPPSYPIRRHRSATNEGAKETRDRGKRATSAACAQPYWSYISATLEPARNVLMCALQLHRSRRTWAMLHDPEKVTVPCRSPMT
jgi:hypothetical protein